MNHSSDPHACTPPPLPVTHTPATRLSRAFPWGFTSMLILLNLVVRLYMVFILPKIQDIYAQLGWILPLPQRILVGMQYIPFGFLLNVSASAFLILVYQRWVMATPWRKWVLLAVAVLCLGMVYLSVANVRWGMAIIEQEQRKARGY